MPRKYRQWMCLLVIAVLLLPLLNSDIEAARVGKWSVLEVNAEGRPDPRKHHTMVYDPENNRVILYGGENQGIDPNDPFDDLWVLNLGSPPEWEEITDATGDNPPGLHGHSAAYDASTERMLLLTGRVDFGTPSSSSFADGVWELDWSDGFVWDQLITFPGGSTKFKACATDPSSCAYPFAKRTHAAASCLSGDLYLMGGQAGTGAIAMHDVWVHPSSGSPEWDHVSGSVTGIASFCESCIDFTIPNLRYWHTMIADGYGRLVVFGGFYEDQAVNNAFVSDDGGQTWDFLGNAPASPHNFSREFHAAAFDSEDDRMVVIGGYIRTGGGTTITGAVTSLPLPETLPSLTPPNDVNNNWVLHETCGTGPGAIAEHAAVYDPVGDRMIVFGGVTSGGTMRNNDVWVLDFSDETAPAAVTDLAAGQVGRYGSTMTWTAPGDDGTTGTACKYDLRRSTSTITEGNFASATPLNTDPPQSAGNTECGETGSVTPCQTYYYALKTIDDAGNVSALSNVLSITQKCSGVSYICGGGLYSATTPAAPAFLEYAIRGSNPASDLTTLFVGIPSDRQGESMELSIFDVTGARVRTLVQESATAGEREMAWDHRTEGGARVASGIYFARLKLGNEVRTHKITVSVGR